MHPADFYSLAQRDRPRATRYLLCYDAHGLRRLAASCAQHLFELFAVRVPTNHVLASWERVGLISQPHAQAARDAAQMRAVGE
jgi:hypothetical protein